MNGVDFPVTRVLDGIAAARDAGLAPIKINTVVRRDLNEASVLPMARWARDEGLILRFIEYMDVGHSNGWRMDDVIPAAELVRRIDAEMPLEPSPPNYPGEVAERWRYVDGSGEVGVIASVSQPFCATCTRARLSAEGKLYTCLFAVAGHDLRGLLRGDRTDEEIAAAIVGVWRVRDDRYSDLRTEATTTSRRSRCSRWAARPEARPGVIPGAGVLSHTNLVDRMSPVTCPIPSSPAEDRPARLRYDPRGVVDKSEPCRMNLVGMGNSAPTRAQRRPNAEGVIPPSARRTMRRPDRG